MLSHHSRLLEPSFKSSCFLELTRQHSTRHTSVIRPSSSLPQNVQVIFWVATRVRPPVVRRTVHWFSVQSRRVKDVWQGGRGRSIAAAASEVTIAIGWTGGRMEWADQSGGWRRLGCIQPELQHEGRRRRWRPRLPKGERVGKCLGFTSTCTWSLLRSPTARIGGVAIHISLKGKYTKSIQI